MMPSADASLHPFIRLCLITNFNCLHRNGWHGLWRHGSNGRRYVHYYSELRPTCLFALDSSTQVS